MCQTPVETVGPKTPLPVSFPLTAKNADVRYRGTQNHRAEFCHKRPIYTLATHHSLTTSRPRAAIENLIFPDLVLALLRYRCLSLCFFVV